MKLKYIISDVFSLKDDSASHDEIKERLVSGGKITGSNMCVLMLAILIASIGLNMNSTAVIIGAMLISPLMGTILARAFGVATAALHQFRISAIGFLIQVVISLITSTTIYFLLSPVSNTTSELLARTTPTIYDVLIAICGGLAGIIGMTRKEKNNVIPGVAIATALMPPLCTCGYGLANGQWRMFIGAGYLFFINSYFIFLSSAIVLQILELPKVQMVDEQLYHKMRKKVVVNTVLIITPSIIAAFFMIMG